MDKPVFSMPEDDIREDNPHFGLRPVAVGDIRAIDLWNEDGGLSITYFCPVSDGQSITEYVYSEACSGWLVGYTGYNSCPSIRPEPICPHCLGGNVTGRCGNLSCKDCGRMWIENREG